MPNVPTPKRFASVKRQITFTWSSSPTPNIAEILMEQGQLHRAAYTYTQTLQMAVRPDGQRSPLAARIFAGMGRLAYERNRLDEAEQNIRQCLELSRIWGDIGQQAYAYAIQARLELARNNPEQAREAMREAELLIGERPLSPHWSIQVRSELARVWLAQGNLERLSQRIQKRGLTINDEIPYQRESEYVLLLRLLLAQGDHEAAVHSFQPIASTSRDNRADGIGHWSPDPSSTGASGKEGDRASPGCSGKSTLPWPNRRDMCAYSSTKAKR